MSPFASGTIRRAACWLATNAARTPAGHHRLPAPRRLLPEWRRPRELAVLDHPFVSGPGVVHEDVELSVFGGDAFEQMADAGVVGVIALHADHGVTELRGIDRPPRCRTRWRLPAAG